MQGTSWTFGVDLEPAPPDVDDGIRRTADCTGCKPVALPAELGTAAVDAVATAESNI